MKVTISKEVLASIHSLAVSASKDEFTPVITQIAITREGDGLRAMATDRYMVASGLYRGVTFEDWAEEDVVLLDPKGLKSVLDIKKSEKHSVMPIDIVKDAETGWVSGVINSVTSIDLGSVSGTFPPVMKLFPRETEPSGVGTLALRPDFLAKLAKVLPPEARPSRDRVWAFEFRSIPESRKPEPVYARYSGADDYELEALIQPAIIHTR
jgi:hypothetical protein